MIPMWIDAPSPMERTESLTYPSEFDLETIPTLSLSVRAYNSLRVMVEKHGSGVLRLTAREMRRTKGCGWMAIGEIMAALDVADIQHKIRKDMPPPFANGGYYMRALKFICQFEFNADPEAIAARFAKG